MNLLFRNLLPFIISLLLISCESSSESSSDSSSDSSEETSTLTGKYNDGTYCADVTYHNSNTGTTNTYKLNVEVENNELTVIHWSNGGWLDESHFTPQELDSDGFCSFTSDKGYDFEVQITGPECTFNDSSKAIYDFENEKKQTTCPRCGNEKESYESYCDDCKDKIENTCSRCGGFEYYVNGGLCSSCKNEEEEERKRKEEEENNNNNE